jgi:hypothetical protein
MLHGADAKDGVPSIGGAPNLTGRKIQQWRRSITIKRRRGRRDWNDSRQNLRRPKDGLLAKEPPRVMSESRCPTSS